MRPSCCADSSLCSLRPGGPKGPRKSARHPTVDLFGTWPMFVWFNYSKNVQWQPQTTKKKYVILTHKIRLLRTSENHCNIKQPQISPQKKDAFSSRKATVSNSIATTQGITALPGIQQNCMGSPGSSKSFFCYFPARNENLLADASQPTLDMAMQNGTSMAQWTRKFC